MAIKREIRDNGDGTKSVRFGDSPTRTEIRKAVDCYLADNRVNGAELALGIAALLEELSWTTITKESHPGYFEGGDE